MDRTHTSWGNVASWYDSLLKEEGTYQRDLILPNILRLLCVKPGDKILDLACGQGFFSRAFHAAGAHVTGIDISPELIDIAKESSPNAIQFRVAPAVDMPFVPNRSMDKVTVVLALQNMENIKDVLVEIRRVLKPDGRLYLVLNHPAFRIPRASSWEWDPKTGDQYRRIDSYLSESAVKIQMHPGDKPSQYTISFHRPLQVYFKHLTNNGFGVTRLEEWNSNRRSQPGPRKAAEDRARKEIPLFLFLEARPA